MFKWLFILFFVFFCSWIFLKEDFPEFVRDSRIADAMNVMTYPVEELVAYYFPEYLVMRNVPQVYRLSVDKIEKFKVDSESRDRQVVYYFYNPEGLSGKLILNSLNRLVKRYPYNKHNIDYLFVAITNDKSGLSLYLKQYPKINFAPYYITKVDYSQVLMLFNGVGLHPHTELPRAIFKKMTHNDYMEMQAGFFTSGRIEELIDQKL